MKLIIRAAWKLSGISTTGPRGTLAFRAVFTRDRLLMLHSVLDFPENEGDSRKLKQTSTNILCL